MDTDDQEPRKTAAPKRDLQGLSIGDLKDYIAELEAEIERARAQIEAKQSVRAGADALFKR
ncbi:MAG: DUF1192 domain-containing protein [Alphaproteobacteria bacterium]|nr:DUF1192 domain-containing protein [Alphaproteobacteria bacterium]